MDNEIEKLREQLAEANARRADLRTALDWANGERDEAIKARDQYLRERDQARLAEERARESLDELDEAIYECLPSDDDDAPLDCVERAADQLRALREERDAAHAREIACATETLAMQRERDSLKAAWEQEKLRSGELRKERDEARSYKTTMMAASSAFESLEHMVRFELHIPESECVREACQRIYAQLDKAKEDGARLQAEVNFLHALRKNECEDFSRVCKERDEARADLHKTNEVLDAIAKALDLDHDDDIQDAVADMVAELERAEESIEDLRAEVERLKERVVDHAAKFESGLNALRKERDEHKARREEYASEARSLRERLKESYGLVRDADSERDEARAECESLRKQVSMLNINCATHYEHGRKVGRWLDEAIEQRDEARAEVKWLREDDKAGLRREADEACKMVTRIEQEAYRIKLEARAEVADAYRRGAEAMRKQVMDWLVQAQAEATVIVVDTAIRGVHKLPIPEER